MESDRITQGRAIRREVLGDAYVDAAAKTTNDFNRPFQELIQEYVWGTLWARPGIDRRTRAMINLGVLTAMGRTEEIKIYLGAAENVGVGQVPRDYNFAADILDRNFKAGRAGSCSGAPKPRKADMPRPKRCCVKRSPGWPWTKKLSTARA